MRSSSSRCWNASGGVTASCWSLRGVASHYVQGDGDGMAWYAPCLRGKANRVKLYEDGRGVKDNSLFNAIHILIPKVVVSYLWNVGLQLRADALK